MTRTKLLRERRRAECARFFGALGRDATPAMCRAIPRMRSMAARCGYSARADRPGHRRCHRRRSKAMRRFKARTAFYLTFAPADCSMEQMRSAFLARPAWDDITASTLPHWDIVDERTGSVSCGEPRYAVPPGYIEWPIRDVVWLIPVTPDQRATALEMLRERRNQRPRRFVALT